MARFRHRANVLLAITNYAVTKRLFHPCGHDRDYADEPILLTLSSISDFARADFFYSDMPIQRHDCENSVFLPAEQLSKTSGGVVRRHCRSCKLTVYMPKMNRISASLRFIRPNCTPPLPARPLSRLPDWLNITLAICIRLLIGAAGFQLKPTSLVTLKVAL